MLIHLKTELEVRNLLSTKKNNKFTLLYYSLWDKYSDVILKKAEKYSENKDVYCVNSWDVPESFAAFKVTSVPTIVDINHGKVQMHVEYPRIYDFFTPKKIREHD